MAAPANELAFSLDTARAAGERFRQREAERSEKLQKLKTEGVTAVESTERVTAHANRLLAQVRAAMPLSGAAVSDELRPFVEAEPFAPGELDKETMERIIGESRDFLSIEFLDRAINVTRSVGRIVTHLPGNLVSYGTGFLVSPHLLLTNRHVLANADAASRSSVEFNYQLDREGNALTVQRFALDPATFFFLSPDGPPLDFALVAVKPLSDKGKKLSDFGFCPLIAEEGKILVGQPVNIIQHPKGELKQVALRENKLIDLLDADGEPFAHYACDTDRGSSGSPVFNDSWEVIALHHSAVPKMNAQGKILKKDGSVFPENGDPDEIDWIANEGIRVSRLVSFLRNANFDDAAKAQLRDELLNTPGVTESLPIPEPPRPAKSPRTSPRSETGGAFMAHNPNSSEATATITVPLTITVSLGGAAPTTTAAAAARPADPTVSHPPEDFTESTKPDPDYSNRHGFNPNFLRFPAPLPGLTNVSKPDAVKVTGAPASNPFELQYFKHSVILNGKRRLAFVSAVNYNPDAEVHYEREGKDTWYFDKRIDNSVQAGPELYTDNPLDRGHLTRRADAAWGDDEEEARLSNNDTFHWSNCSPQHEVFNQSTKATAQGLRLWGNLENHVAEQANNNNKKLSIFNGPIFRANDRLYRGIRLPREFWKMIAFETDEGKPAAVAFVLSQATLIKALPQEDFEIGPYAVYQVRIADLEKKTNLDFSVFKQFEPFPGGADESFLEAAVELAPLQRLSDIRLK